MTKRIVLTHWWNEHRARGLTTLFPSPARFLAQGRTYCSFEQSLCWRNPTRGLRCNKLCIMFTPRQNSGVIRRPGFYSSTGWLSSVVSGVNDDLCEDCAWDQLGAGPVMASRG